MRTTTLNLTNSSSSGQASKKLVIKNLRGFNIVNKNLVLIINY